MLIRVVHRDGSLTERSIEVGAKVKGLRIDSFVIEWPAEMDYLLTPEGIYWYRRHLAYAWHTNKL